MSPGYMGGCLGKKEKKNTISYTVDLNDIDCMSTKADKIITTLIAKLTVKKADLKIIATEEIFNLVNECIASGYLLDEISQNPYYHLFLHVWALTRARAINSADLQVKKNLTLFVYLFELFSLFVFDAALERKASSSRLTSAKLPRKESPSNDSSDETKNSQELSSSYENLVKNVLAPLETYKNDLVFVITDVHISLLAKSSIENQWIEAICNRIDQWKKKNSSEQEE